MHRHESAELARLERTDFVQAGRIVEADLEVALFSELRVQIVHELSDCAPQVGLESVEVGLYYLDEVGVWELVLRNVLLVNE